jgi:hypothetical protein
MSYLVDFSWVMHPDNPNSLFMDLAWRANIYTDKFESVITARHSGLPDASIEYEVEDAELLSKFRDYLLTILPDSIDPLYDYLEPQIKDRLAEATF